MTIPGIRPADARAQLAPRMVPAEGRADDPDRAQQRGRGRRKVDAEEAASRDAASSDRPAGRFGMIGGHDTCANRHCLRPIIPSGHIVFALAKDYAPYHRGMVLCPPCARSLHEDTARRWEAHREGIRQAGYSDKAIDRVAQGIAKHQPKSNVVHR